MATTVSMVGNVQFDGVLFSRPPYGKTAELFEVTGIDGMGVHGKGARGRQTVITGEASFSSESDRNAAWIDCCNLQGYITQIYSNQGTCWVNVFVHNVRDLPIDGTNPPDPSKVALFATNNKPYLLKVAFEVTKIA